MGINNDGYTIHINFTKEEFLQYKELLNISDRSAVAGEVKGSFGGYNEDTYRDAGMTAWNALRDAEREYDKRHDIRV